MNNDTQAARHPAKSDREDFPSRLRKNKFAFALCTTLVLLLALLVTTMFGGRVSGEQFCPELFQRRRFSYHRIPVIRIQVMPVRRSMVTNDLETHLSNNRYIPFVTGGKPRWDLVKIDSVTSEDSAGDAADLCAYLDRYDENGDHKWLKWTEKNSSLARVLWPAIAEVAREELYYFCPDLFQLAESATNAQILQKQLDQMLSDKYLRLADVKRQLDQPASASRLFRLALNHGHDSRRQPSPGSTRPDSTPTH